MTIEFVASKMVEEDLEVEIEGEDVDNEMKYREASLMMYVIGKDLSMNDVKQFMTRFWNFIKLSEMFYHEEWYFIIRFKSFASKETVQMKGPYTIYNMPMILKDWSQDFNFKRDMLRTLPIWVTLPHIPLHLWGPKSLSKIGSVLGNPLFTNECTTNKLRISNARILVEIDITQK
ncbi:unnamed protein product [Lathyrus sativus]|nr:unnamed protein product [Lathyrus sativus]